MTPFRRWTLTASIIGSAVVFLDSTIVTVALPQIGEELTSARFGVLEAQSYVYSGYLLALASLLVLAGALTDYHGRKRLFIIGIVGFAGASLLAGLSVSMEMLIVSRVLQGAAGAFLIPGSLALITASFDEESQGRAFGIWAGASAVTMILGPFLGGVLVDLLSWRAAFLVNVPILAFGAWVTVSFVAESRDEDATGGFDWTGAGIVALAVGGLGFGAIRGQESQWTDAGAFIGLAVGSIAAVAIPVWTLRSAHPLVAPSLFRSRNFTVVNIATLVIYGAIYVIFYFVPVYLQGVLGYNAAASGVALAIATLFLALFSAKFGKLGSRYGPRRFMAGGSFLMGLGVLWLARMPATSERWIVDLSRPSSLMPPADTLIDVVPGVALFGVGLVTMVAPLTTALMTSVPQQMAGVASAFNNAVSRVGPPLATAAIFIVANSIFFSSLGDLAPELDTGSPVVREEFAPLNGPAAGTPESLVAAAAGASTDAFSFAMVVAAGMFVAGALVSYLGVQDPQRSDDVGASSAMVPGPVSGCPPLDIECAPAEPGEPAAA